MANRHGNDGKEAVVSRPSDAVCMEPLPCIDREPKAHAPSPDDEVRTAIRNQPVSTLTLAPGDTNL